MTSQRCFGAVVVLALFGVLSSAPAETQAEETTAAVRLSLPSRTHPFLFGDAEVYAQARRRAEKFEWAADELNRITRRAEQIVQSPLEVPTEAGQWSHYYVCKKDGTNLVHEMGKNICPRCKTTYAGWPFDQIVAGNVHAENVAAIEQLGLAYALTGDTRYADRARRNLLAYAERYRSWPIHDVWGKESKRGARLSAQTLNESFHALRMAWGYDLIYGSPNMTDADRKKIEEDLLRPLAETILRFDAGISNWQSWHNAALAAVGFCLQDADLAGRALYGPSGLRFQLEKCVLSDGFWHEGSPSYHYYALKALAWTTEIARAAGIDFYDARYKSLFDAPLDYVFPNLEFPAVNDSSVFRITAERDLYELAWSRFGDIRYLPVLRDGKRRGTEALLRGTDELPSRGTMSAPSRDFAGIGAAVLQRRTGPERMYLHLDYGPHGGGHGHPDKLAIVLFALGRQLAPDPGALKYAAPLHGQWYKTTLAHNTLVVDGRDQKQAEGRLTRFSPGTDRSLCQAVCDTAYPGVQMTRTLLMTDRYLVDVFDADSRTSHTYDYVYHNEGKLKPSIAAQATGEPLGSKNGYQHVKDVARARTSDGWHADFVQAEASLRFSMPAQGAADLYFGIGLTDKPPRDCPMLIARRTAERARFVTVLEPYADRPAVKSVHLEPAEAAPGTAQTLTVDLVDGSHETVILPGILRDAAPKFRPHAR